MSTTAGIECRPESHLINPMQATRLARAVEYVQQNCHTLLLLDQVAETAGLSKFHFHRLFKQYTGKTLKRFATECQVEFGKRLLREGLKAGDAATRAGFANQSHFTTRFKMITGMTPAKWLKAQRAQKSAAVASA